MGRPRVSPPDVVRPISFSIGIADLEALDLAALREGVARSVLIREMIADGLVRFEAAGEVL